MGIDSDGNRWSGNCEYTKKSKNKQISIGLEMTGLEIIGLEMIRLDVIGLEMIGLEMIWLETISVDMIGLETIGLEMIVNHSKHIDIHLSIVHYSAVQIIVHFYEITV